MNTQTLLKWRKWSFIALAAAFLLAIAGFLLVALLPGLFGGEAFTPTLIVGVLPVASMLLLVLAMLLVWPYWLLVLITVATSKNKTDYKVIWLLAMIFLWLIGSGLWEIFGKRELELSKR